MNMRFLVLLLIAGMATVASAQTSTLSKSKKRFREKDMPGNKVTVTNAVNLNSESPDYSPAFYQNGLVYVSSRRKTGTTDRRTGETYAELYFAPFDPNLNPAKPQRFSLDINSILHEGPVTFSRDFKQMYYTQNNMKDGSPKADDKGVRRLKIYEAYRGPYTWQNRGELPFCSDLYSCAHPSLSADGSTLYFSSDMPGGQGGYDLWRTTRQPNGAWGQPENLGPDVNTDKNELFPFIHSSGTLFFSSNGHNTLGGLDIFYVEMGSDGSTTIVNLDKPYNSEQDDLGFIINDEMQRGFFASNRTASPDGSGGSKGKDDVFMFVIEKGLENLRPSTREGRIVVTDARTGRPIQGANIRVLKSTSDGFADNAQEVYDIELQPVMGAEGEVMTVQLRPKNSEQMRPADYSSNTEGEAPVSFLRYRSYVVMVDHPNYQMAQQFVTSEDEAGEAIVRVALQPTPICHTVRGTVMTEQLGSRIANARVKFVHKVSGREEVVRTGRNGEYYACLTLPGDYLVKVERNGFQAENFSVQATATQEQSTETRLRPVKLVSPESDQSLASEVQDGMVIQLDQSDYEAKQTTLNQGAVRQLDAIYQLLQRYPDAEVTITGHTDARGDARANQSLSEERASNAGAYLEYRGISPKRIKTQGKGSTEPINPCTGTPCTDAQHRANQRLTVRFSRGKA
jgi:outer membrane protein OmpA-like peptidoglycan-associated protein